MRRAILSGTPEQPRILVSFPYNARHPDTSCSLIEWVKALPGRRFDDQTKTWTVTAPGPDFLTTFVNAGFEVDLFDAPLGVGDLYRPLVRMAGPRTVEIFPRFVGPGPVNRRLGGDGDWDAEHGRLVAPLTALAPWPDRLVPPDVRAARDEAIRASADVPDLSGATRHTAVAADERGVEEHVGELRAHFGDVPDWFGMTPYPYQRVGALSVAGGRRLLADEPGLGKSLQAIVVSHLLSARRTLIVCPPVVQSNWAREVERTTIAQHLGPDASVALIRPGRKVPELPQTGFVIATDSLLASSSRTSLVQDLKSWSGDLFVYDEVHRAKTWEAKRSRVMRDLALCFEARVGLSGTPMMSNPAELASVLAITGQLGPVFGGRDAFLDRYTKKNPFGAFVPRKENLPELGRILREQVWVRRTKDQVLPDLPEKTRQTRLVDVPLTEYRAAHEKVEAKVVNHLLERYGELGEMPDEDEMKVWCRGQIGLVSLLRQAAGVSKIEAAADYIADWFDASPRRTDATYDRPLIAWAIHRPVIDALAQRLDQSSITYAIIRGDTSDSERDRIVSQYQAGRIGVLLANIIAAGVGITLTRGSDALFVETEWLPDLVTQAEDRQHRIGQASTVTAVTLVAPGTLDSTIQRVLRRNIGVLDAVMGGFEHHVAASDDDIASRSVSAIMWDIVAPTLERFSDPKVVRRALAAA